MMMCVMCVNNTPPQPAIQFDDIYDEIPINEPEITNVEYGHDGPLVDITLVLEYMEQNHLIPLYEPPVDFDMNSASLVEQNPDYMDNMINSQIEYEGKWYFVLDGQIYSIPEEIEVDDNYDRQDIVDNWDNVEWVGTIFGEYVAWR